MGKITTEIRYKDRTFELRRTLHSYQLRLFISKEEDYAIVVNDDDEVLFELEAYSVFNVPGIEDVTDED